MATNPTRADVLTGARKQPDFFSDFLDSFAMTPYGNDLAKITNNKSVNQSIKNLIKTNLGERLFQPTIGSNVNATLFELNNEDVFSNLELLIKETIENNEPRVILLGVLVKTMAEDEHNIEITIAYNLINNPEPITFTLLLKRVR
jgi:phage baseplate assembly protein W